MAVVAQNRPQRGFNAITHWHAASANQLIRKGKFGGRDRDRTGDPLLAKQVLSQLSYTPNASFHFIGPSSGCLCNGKHYTKGRLAGDAVADASGEI